MKLYSFIGLNENDELQLHVSPFKLNKLSPMHERGKPFPAGSYDTIEQQDALSMLKKIDSYFNEYEASKKPKKK